MEKFKIGDVFFLKDNPELYKEDFLDDTLEVVKDSKQYASIKF